MSPTTVTQTLTAPQFAAITDFTDLHLEFKANISGTVSGVGASAGVGGSSVVGSGSVAYVGLGDVVSGAFSYWGPRAYSAATIGTNSIRLRRDSDNAESDFATIAGGGLDLAAIASWKGSANLYVTKIYDQTGNGYDLSQTTSGNQPPFLLNAVASKPAMQFTNSVKSFLMRNVSGITLGSQPFTASVFINNTGIGANTAFSVFTQAGGSTGNVVGFGIDSVPGKSYLYAGATMDVDCSAGAWHAIQGLFNTSSSKQQVDTTLTTGGNIGTNTGGSNLIILGAADEAGSFAYNGYVTENAWWTGDKSSSFSALNSNQQAYWAAGSVGATGGTGAATATATASFTAVGAATGAGAAAAVSLDAATSAWVTAVVANGGTVSSGRQIIVNNLITGLKSDGIWSKLDRLWLHAAENTQSALTDLVTDTLATSVNSPTFTTDRGYTGSDQTSPTSYIDSGYNTSTSGVNFTQNAASLSAWNVTNNASSAGGCIIGSSTSSGGMSSLYATFLDNGLYARVNDDPQSNYISLSPATRAGHWFANRSGSSAVQVYQNASSFGSTTQPTGVPISLNLYILCLNNNGSTYGGTPNQIAMTSIGGNFSSTDVTNFYNRLRTYMTAVGVP